MSTLSEENILSPEEIENLFMDENDNKENNQPPQEEKEEPTDGGEEEGKKKKDKTTEVNPEDLFEEEPLRAEKGNLLASFFVVGLQRLASQPPACALEILAQRLHEFRRVALQSQDDP